MATDAVSLKADIREKSGSHESIRLRKEGKLPAVVYGHQQASVSISVDAREFVRGLHHGHRLFTVDLGGKAETLLLKTIQYDYLGKDVIHADLIRVDLSERVTVDVPLVFKGVAKGTMMGGMLEEALTHLEIECGVTAIPEMITVNVRELGIGDSMHAKDLVMPAGVELKTSPDALIVICLESKVAAAETVEGAEGAEAAPAQPEVITERKKEEASE
jgi:large subunit ribosomal protein L25